MIFRLCVFLATLVVVQSYRDIREFCLQSKFLQELSETLPIYNSKKYTCTIELPFIADDNRTAEYICSYYSPFPTLDIVRKEETIECTYQTKRYCSEGAHLIQNVCIRITKKGLAYKNYTTNTCTNGYKTLKILNRDMARWISTLGVIGAEGIWIDQASLADSSPSDQSQKKYLNLVLSLSKNKKVSSILYTTPEKELFGVCVAEKYGEHGQDADSNANVARYFLTENFYHPSSINGYITAKIDNFKEMDDMCKQINPNSMLAPGIPSETVIDGMTPNSLVYVGVRAVVKAGFDKAQQDCSKTKDRKHWAEKFHAILHPVNGNVRETGLNASYFKSNHRYHACADVPKTAVAYDGKNLIDIIPIARLRIACVTGKVSGLKVDNRCGTGGNYNASSGECVCKEDWVDISTLDHIVGSTNYGKGEVCVPEIHCKQQKNFIIFLMDASRENHKRHWETFTGLKHFVDMAKTLIHNTNDIGFVAYGGNTEFGVRGTMLKPGWTKVDFEEGIIKVANKTLGFSSNCADGFDKTKELLTNYTRSHPGNSLGSRIVIHVGDGDCIGWRSDKSHRAYDQMRPFADRVIAASVHTPHDNIRYKWHTDDDFYVFNLRPENVHKSTMSFLLSKVCKENSEMIEETYGTNDR